MDYFPRSVSSSRLEDQVRQDRSKTAEQREKRNTRFLKSVTDGSSSSSDMNPLTVSELDQGRDQQRVTQQGGDQQRVTQQERNRGILRRMISCISVPCEIYENFERGIQDANQRLADELRSRQEQSRNKQLMHDAGQLLGIDLSRVKTETWTSFSSNLLVEHGELFNDEPTHGEAKNLILLGDILYGGTTKYVTKEGRDDKEYKEMKQWVIKKWEEFKEQAQVVTPGEQDPDNTVS